MRIAPLMNILTYNRYALSRGCMLPMPCSWRMGAAREVSLPCHNGTCLRRRSFCTLNCRRYKSNIFSVPGRVVYHVTYSNLVGSGGDSLIGHQLTRHRARGTPTGSLQVWLLSFNPLAAVNLAYMNLIQNTFCQHLPFKLLHRTI